MIETMPIIVMWIESAIFQTDQKIHVQTEKKGKSSVRVLYGSIA